MSALTDDSTALVRYERSGPIATITLDRPEKLNAFTDQMVRDLAAALRRFDLDDGAAVAVLAGAGRAFSSGADVKERQTRPREELVTLPSPEGWDADSSQLLTRAVHWKPVVAAVHGYVLGMAVGLALECDLVVAAEDARFQILETARGLSPIRYWALLAWRCGEAVATHVAATGAMVSAGRALEMNMVHRCVPSDGLSSAAEEAAAELAAMPPLALRALVRARRHRIRQINEWARYENELHRLHLSGEFGDRAAAFVASRSGDQVGER